MGDMHVVDGGGFSVISAHLVGDVYLEVCAVNMLPYLVVYISYFDWAWGSFILIIQTVRDILAQHGRLAVPLNELLDDSDLYHAGLTSLATVSLMLALEEEFDVEFPDSMLSRKTFGSIESIVDAIESLQD